MPEDQVVAGCLAKIRKGDLSACGVLADRLDEIGHKLAKKIRKLYDRYDLGVSYWRSAGPLNPRGRTRRVSRGDRVYRWNRWLWHRVREIFSEEGIWLWPDARLFREPILEVSDD